ncbi:MAG: DUF4118 domain-containing protein [Bacteroidales bacterium]|nr:DUF4118 domain-containing protein [Bacteroidales bacterium]
MNRFLSGAVKFRIFHYLLAILVIGGTTFLCIPLAQTQNYHVVSFILLFVVSILSIFMGVGPVLLASTLSALVWNYFFIPPHYTFHIEKTEDLLIFGLFFIIVLVNGVLTTRVRRQEKSAREKEKRTNALFQLTKELSRASGMDEVLKVAGNEIKNHFSLHSYFILQDGNNTLNPAFRKQKEEEITPAEFNVAEWVFKSSRPAGAHTSNPFTADHTFFPLLGTRLNPGVVAVKQIQPFFDDQRSFWETFLTQISNALEREFLGELAQKVRFLDESDRLYKTLFSSISHELRIPVATIMAASESIISSSNTGNIQTELCHEIFTASLRLNRLIENLLNISRLETGHLSVRLDWHDINDLVNKVTEDLKDELKPFSMKMTIPEEMPLVKIDFGLMEQVFYNLLLNSTQYAPGASKIEMDISFNNEAMIITLTDKGPGFPEDDLKNVFKKFFRVKGSSTGGLGLGLSIVKGFVEAHKGWVSVENVKQGGARFTILIPSEKPDIKNL